MRASDLRQRRNALGLTQLSLARLLGVASNTVARWERGKLSIPSQTSRLLGVLEGTAELEEGMTPEPEALRRLGEAFARAGLTMEEDEAAVFLSESQAAERLGVSRAEVKRLDEEGRLKALRQPFGTSRPGALVVTDKGERAYPEEQVLKLKSQRSRKRKAS
jgi:transcriptional regulator with XRE-family HTH domain